MRKVFCIAVIFTLAVSCGRVPEQHLAESQTIRRVRDFLQSYSLLHSNQTATNLQQVYKGYWDRPYPYAWHKDFKKYGKYSGFKDSFFEKYWFFPPGSTSEIVRGEVVMMNSHPFPIDKGKLGRSIVFKRNDRYDHDQFSEDVIQRMLKEEQITPYDLPAFSAPPPEPRSRFPGEPPDWIIRVNVFFDRVAESLGISIAYSWLLRNVVIGLILAIGIAGTWLLWRQARRE